MVCTLIGTTAMKVSNEPGLDYNIFKSIFCYFIFMFMATFDCYTFAFMIPFSIEYYDPFQSIIHKFITSKERQHENHRNLRCIAVHHYLSKSIQEFKDKKLNHYNVEQMRIICDRKRYLDEIFASKDTLNIDETLKRLMSLHMNTFFFRGGQIVICMTWIISNVSMIRLLFWSGTDLTIYQWQSILFLGKAVFELLCMAMILIWMRFNEKAWIIYKRWNREPEGKLMQFCKYYELLKQSQSHLVMTGKLDQIGMDFYCEITRFYDLWNAKYMRPKIERILFETFGDSSSIICDYSFGKVDDTIEIEFELGSENQNSKKIL